MPKLWIRWLFAVSLVIPAVASAEMGGPVQFGSPFSNDKWMRDQKIYRETTEREKNLQNIGRAPAPVAAPPVVQEPVEELDSDDEMEMEDDSEEMVDDESDESEDEAMDSDEDEDEEFASDDDGDEDVADADSEDLSEDDE